MHEGEGKMCLGLLCMVFKTGPDRPVQPVQPGTGPLSVTPLAPLPHAVCPLCLTPVTPLPHAACPLCLTPVTHFHWCRLLSKSQPVFSSLDPPLPHAASHIPGSPPLSACSSPFAAPSSFAVHSTATGQVMHVSVDLGFHKPVTVPPSRPGDSSLMVAKISGLTPLHQTTLLKSEPHKESSTFTGLGPWGYSLSPF
uniref:Uncharacterized protein n=1 Tax=Fagus sylvatica TaxID=28930 RepID=A0A2N9H5M9_FAGSY